MPTAGGNCVFPLQFQSHLCYFCPLASLCPSASMLHTKSVPMPTTTDLTQRQGVPGQEMFSVVRSILGHFASCFGGSPPVQCAVGKGGAIKTYAQNRLFEEGILQVWMGGFVVVGGGGGKCTAGTLQDGRKDIWAACRSLPRLQLLDPTQKQVRSPRFPVHIHAHKLQRAVAVAHIGEASAAHRPAHGASGGPAAAALCCLCMRACGGEYSPSCEGPFYSTSNSSGTPAVCNCQPPPPPPGTTTTTTVLTTTTSSCLNSLSSCPLKCTPAAPVSPHKAGIKLESWWAHRSGRAERGFDMKQK